MEKNYLKLSENYLNSANEARPKQILTAPLAAVLRREINFL